MRTLTVTLVLMIAGTPSAFGQTTGGKFMATMYPSRHLSVQIHRTPLDVYNFTAVPENWPQWASGLGKSLTKKNGEWIADTPQGPVKVRFTERNAFGILDHYVMPTPGVEIYIPLRVIANGSGSELIFTLFRLPDASEEKFVADANAVIRDLAALKTLLEEQ